MPIEIRELVVKVIIEDEKKEPANFWDSLSGDKEESKDLIVEECVEQVLQILKDKKEP